jgi:hypothetical protein
MPSPQGIVKILLACIRSGIQCAQPAFNWHCTRQMMIANRLPERSRSTMHHQPEPILLVRLQLKEMVSAAKSRKLDLAFLSAHSLQAGMAQWLVYQFRWLRKNCIPVASSRRHCSPKFFQQLSCNPRILQLRSLSIDRDSQHSASNVSSHGLRINQVRGRDDNPDAHLSSKMYIWHHGDLLNVRGASETPKRLRHVRIQWRCQPTPQRRL